MPPVPSVRGERVVRALEKARFAGRALPEAITLCVTSMGRGIMVLVHHGHDVAKGTLRGIVSDADMTIEELQGLL